MVAMADTLEVQDKNKTDKGITLFMTFVKAVTPEVQYVYTDKEFAPLDRLMNEVFELTEAQLSQNTVFQKMSSSPQVRVDQRGAQSTVIKRFDDFCNGIRSKSQSEKGSSIDIVEVCSAVRSKSDQGRPASKFSSALLSQPAFLKYYRENKKFQSANPLECSMMLEFVRKSDISYPLMDQQNEHLIVKQREMLDVLLDDKAESLEDLKGIMKTCLEGRDRINPDLPWRKKRDEGLQEKLESALIEKSLGNPERLAALIAVCSGNDSYSHIEKKLIEKSKNSEPNLDALKRAYMDVMSEYYNVVKRALEIKVGAGSEKAPKLVNTLETRFNKVTDPKGGTDGFLAAAKSLFAGSDESDYAQDINGLLRGAAASKCFSNMVIANFRLREVLKNLVQPQPSQVIGSSSGKADEIAKKVSPAGSSAMDIVTEKNLQAVWREVKESCTATGTERQQILGNILMSVTGLSTKQYNEAVKNQGGSAVCFTASNKGKQDILKSLKGEVEKLKGNQGEDPGLTTNTP
jgi:hypothetical protein